MNKNIKLAVAALLIGLGIYMMFFTRETGWGVVVFLLSALPIFLYFKNENINLEYIINEFPKLNIHNLFVDYIKKIILSTTNLKLNMARIHYLAF